jgi:hypothetical protein
MVAGRSENVGTATATIEDSIATALPSVIGELVGDIRHLPMEVRALVSSSGSLRRRLETSGRACGIRFCLNLSFARATRAPGAERSLTCHTRDRNDGHIAFLSKAMLPMGSAVVLDFTTRPETQPLGRIQARVRRCRQFASGWFECVAMVGTDARCEPTGSWERFTHWVGEFTGFGPDRRSEFERQVAAKRKSK